MIIDPAYIVMRLTQGTTAAELANELGLTPRHVRRLAKAVGWTPAPRRHTGPRTLKVQVSSETYAALEKRGGKSVEDTAGALLVMTADKDKIANERAAAASAGAGPWAAGYLDALVAGIERVR